jgi:hypothetical protein
MPNVPANSVPTQITQLKTTPKTGKSVTSSLK